MKTLLRNTLLCCATSLLPLLAQSDTDTLEKTNATTRAESAYRETRIIGFTRAAAEIQIVAETSGRCLEVFADVGEALPKSGTFARLDDTFIRLEVASNSNRQAALTSRSSYLKRELERSQTLNQSAALSASELDQIQQQYDQAMLDLQALKTEAQILQERFDRHQVTVHADWHIISRAVEPGQWVAAGMPIGRAADYSSLRVPISLTYQEFRYLSAMASIPITLVDLEQKVNAKLVKVSPGFDPVTRKIQAELQITTQTSDQRGGLRVEMLIPSEAEAHTFLVDSAAINERYNTFWLKRSDGSEVEVSVLERKPNQVTKVRSREIKTGDLFSIEAGKL